MKWNETRKNFKVGNIVLLKDEHSQNQWPMARLVRTESNKNGIVRSAVLKLGNTKSSETLSRPISKLALLIGDDENWISKKVRFPDEGVFGCREY